MPNVKFNDFLPELQKLNRDGVLTKQDLLKKEFLISKSEELEIYYSPHNEYINRDAMIVIVGITPGWNQMKTAYEQLLKSLDHTKNPEQMLKEVKIAASFAGSMRGNLTDMLNECGLPEVLSINSSLSLFTENRDLLHTTSIIKYPVFIEGKNYTGHRPSIHQSPITAPYANEVFPEELAQIRKPALIIPLGKTVDQIISNLLAEKKLSENHTYLFGFPHPSGANGHRKKQFQEHKASLIAAIRKWSCARD